ncbi:MAG: DUF3829 domain-containing protein [Polyangiales bacterium]
MKRIVPIVAAWLAIVAISHPSGASADARSDKVQLYIEVYNTFASTMHTRHERLVRGLEGRDAQNPCTVDHPPSGIFYNAGDATGTIPGYERRLRRAPRLPQDRLVQQMMDAAKAEIEAWNGADDYYRRRVYTTDACAQGNAYHRTLVGSYESFFAAERDVLAFVDEESRSMRVEALRRVEREHGRNFRYYQASIMNDVESVRDLLQAETLDLDALSRAVESVATQAGEIGPRAETAPREVHSDLYSGQYLTFLGRINTFVGRGRELVTVLRNAQSTPRDREGAGRDFERAFSDAIEASNRVRYSNRVE